MYTFTINLEVYLETSCEKKLSSWAYLHKLTILSKVKDPDFL